MMAYITILLLMLQAQTAQAPQTPPAPVISQIPYVSEVTDFISRFASIATVIITTFTAFIMQKVKTELAQYRLEMEQVKGAMAKEMTEFKIALLKELSSAFLPKPATDGDWPLTRREFENYLIGAKEARAKLESEIRDLKTTK